MTQLNNYKKLAILLLGMFSLVGCTIAPQKNNYEEFYHQVSPTKYPITTDSMLFEYQNIDLDEIYEMLFSDYLVVGKSTFNAPYSSPSNATEYAQSIGSDLFIVNSQFKETKTSFVQRVSPTINYTRITGYNGEGASYGHLTTYSTQTSIIPIEVDRYDHQGFFLKNINNVAPLWDRKRDQYQETDHSELSGEWYNEDYKMELIKSGDQMIAFMLEITNEEVLKDKDINVNAQLKIYRNRNVTPKIMQKESEIKLIFGTGSGVGIFLMNDKMPVPATFKVNNFGHLEVKLLTNSKVFSFAKSL